MHFVGTRFARNEWLLQVPGDAVCWLVLAVRLWRLTRDLA